MNDEPTCVLALVISPDGSKFAWVEQVQNVPNGILASAAIQLQDMLAQRMRPKPEENPQIVQADPHLLNILNKRNGQQP